MQHSLCCAYFDGNYFSLLQGVKIKMDDAGNILIRRYSKNNVYIKSTATAPNEETAIGNDVLKAPNQCLEIEKVYKVIAIGIVWCLECVVY